MHRSARSLALGVLVLCASATPAFAYIGPGAGFAVGGAVFALLGTFLLAFGIILIWPFKAAVRMVLPAKRGAGKVGRVVVIGLDGLDPGLAQEYMAAGRMPHLAQLQAEGCFHPLRTACPSISPVAWSTFATGVDASRHNIYDFLTRDPCNYAPMLSSSDVRSVPRTLNLGFARVPWGNRVSVRSMQKSQPFWKLLGNARVWSTILRVPITFPPQPFKNGTLLSGMCVPDLQGTQGSFSFYSTRERPAGAHTGGQQFRVVIRHDRIESNLTGPHGKDGAPMKSPFSVDLDAARNKVRIQVGHETVVVGPQEYTPWMVVPFDGVQGIVRLRVQTWAGGDFELYATPIHIDPEKPALPISHPFVYSIYLAKLHGKFATLGLAEDTWALNERVIDEEAFLSQAWIFFEERKKQLWDALDKTRKGFVTVVFDTSDRISHMFWRTLEADHPANHDKEVERWRDVIPDTYARMDAMVGEARAKIGADSDTLLMVISDHGFTSFKRGVNLNTWLRDGGYLVLKPGHTTSGDWFADVDWDKTRAFTLGLTGLFINRRGREAHGIVEHAELDALCREIKGKLERLRDPATGEPVVREAFLTRGMHDGPYADAAPEILVGYHKGFRHSWDCATGSVSEVVFTDNTKSWSGDHCVDPRLVPGVFWCNRKLTVDDPALMDIAPTVLDLFGVEVPRYMQGRALFGDAVVQRASTAAPRSGSTRVRLPRWTVYPALAVLAAFLIPALPGRKPAERALVIPEAATKFPRSVVLGVDGLDPDVLRDVMAKHPAITSNWKWLVDAGGLHELDTTAPPQSPVAWSTFITGMDPGGHGIFDFLHRDLVTRAPVPSTTKSEDVDVIALPGDWQFPLGGDSESNRTGDAFWKVLADQGVPAHIWRMPANFPVEPAKGLSFSGMMTPAIDSAYGLCTLWTTDASADSFSHDSKIIPVREDEGRIDTYLTGPDNAFKKSGGVVRVPLRILVDRDADAATLEIGGRLLVLRAGQWSDFVRVSFDLLPAGTSKVPGIVRFYLRSVSPAVEVYASPVNIDPIDPVVPVSAPRSASADAARAVGLFYTQGMPEDVNALKSEIITDVEFMQQSALVHDEGKRLMDYAIQRWLAEKDGGFLFFYFSGVDLCSHMMWRHADEQHPFHDDGFAHSSSKVWSGREGSTWRDVVEDLYLRMDPVIGDLRAQMPEGTTLMVVSDHGFATFRRKFSLNTWLVDHGYLVLKAGRSKELARGDAQREPVYIFDAVDWSKTRAYGMGFNGLYLNLRGRERDDPRTSEDESGIVEPGSAAQALVLEIKTALEAERDGDARPILRCDVATDVYRGARVGEAPELIVGYNAGYGNSDESSTGRIPRDVYEDNDRSGTFNGNHLMAPDVVPGTLLSNRRIAAGRHRLEDVTVEILRQYGIQPTSGMHGKPVLE